MKYPKGTKPPKATAHKTALPSSKKSLTGNRGMGFEADINETNLYYIEKGLALVYKRPTPINVVKVDYAKGAKIKEAYFEKQSTTDYNGVIQGHYVDFEAKSTRNLSSFPLHNIPLQQIEHLERVMKSAGIAFFLINFYTLQETYLLPASFVCAFYRSKKRSSIPLKDIRENGTLVKEGVRPRFDYLSAIKDKFSL